jgi:hypothetical protein
VGGDAFVAQTPLETSDETWCSTGIYGHLYWIACSTQFHQAFNVLKSRAPNTPDSGRTANKGEGKTLLTI